MEGGTAARKRTARRLARLSTQAPRRRTRRHLVSKSSENHSLTDGIILGHLGRFSARRDTRLERLATAVVRRACRGRRAGGVAVFFLPPAAMRYLKLNYRIRRLPGRRGRLPTFVDVLSFPEPDRFPHPGRRRPPLGEVYLNEKLLQGPRERLDALLVHGTLHLIGYRHDRKRDTITMEMLERKLSAELTPRKRLM